MNRLPIEWIQQRDVDDLPEHLDKDEYEPVLEVRVREDWVAVDNDQLVLPIAVRYKEGISHDAQPALLKQYGGERLLNTMLLADQPLEPGSCWTFRLDPTGQVVVTPADDS